jgi:hypothetical protein
MSSFALFIASTPKDAQGFSDVEVAALEVFFFDPATLDFVLAIIGLLLCMLRLVLSSPTPNDKMVSKPSPSPLASFSEGFSPFS